MRIFGLLQGAFEKERGRPRPRVPVSSWLRALKDTRTEASALLLERTLDFELFFAEDERSLAELTKPQEIPSPPPKKSSSV